MNSINFELNVTLKIQIMFFKDPTHNKIEQFKINKFIRNQSCITSNLYQIIKH